MIIGYYLFFGSGDYHKPHDEDINWTYHWDLTQWKKLIDQFVELQVNTVMLYLNGHVLPYHSEIYPDLVDCENSRDRSRLLSELLAYIKYADLKIIGVLTTTGHAGGFAQHNPETQIEVLSEISGVEQTLVSFPEHMRKGKMQKKEGAAQLGFGVLCHHKTKARIYAQNVLQELLGEYGQYFDGIALHPPESGYPCVCAQCCEIYYTETGLDLKSESFDDACLFFIRSYLLFQRDTLFSLIREKSPAYNLFTFTIPWFFELNFKKCIEYIPQDITLIEWDYNLDADRVNTLSQRIGRYIDEGYNLIFMPSAGFSINNQKNVEQQILSIHQQIHEAEQIGSCGITHFIGPKISQDLTATSYVAAHAYRKALQDSQNVKRCCD